MEKNKAFQCCYILILAAFIIFSTMLAVRLVERQRSNKFYEVEGAENPMPLAKESALHEIQKLSLHLARFTEKYADAAVWLQLPDTTLNYPVMLGADNQFYLNHLPDGNKNALGSLFLDCRTNKDSKHLIIYGHNGLGGEMFGLLKEYESQDYFLEHQTLTIATLDDVYVCPIFSVRRINANCDAYRLEFEDDGLTSYINQAREESLYLIDVDLTDASKVLTLSTCTGWNNQRFIVQAVMKQKDG